MSFTDTLLPEFDQEMGNTGKLPARLPDTIGTWKPDEKSMDLRRLAGHVAELPGRAVVTINSDSPALTRGASGGSSR